MPRLAALALGAALCAALLAPSAQARDGWETRETTKSYAALLADLKAAVRAAKWGLVTEAGPTEVAKKRGFDIPGNRVVGVFRNDYAVRILGLSEDAMIEAPIRFYVTEREGGARLAWKRPSAVFAPYADQGGAALAEAAAEIDAVFDAIAAAAVE